MTYLSQFRVEPSAVQRYKLWDNYAWHGAVWDLFPGQERNARDFLFRLDRMRLRTRLLLLSPRPPILAPWGEGRTKEISPQFLSHDAYRFQVKTNPTRRSKESGKRVGIYGEEDLTAWIERKAEDAGFAVLQDSLTIRPPMAEYFVRNGEKGKHISVDFSGLLKVTNRSDFEKAFYQGIGPAKAFGFGMLMLQPLLMNP